MSVSTGGNLGEDVSVKYAIASTAATAAGAGDNTAITGATIDLQAAGYPREALLAMGFTTALAANKTLTFKTVLITHDTASNMGTEATLATFSDVVVATDSGSGSTITGTQEYRAALAGANRYVRFKLTPDLNASGTDTATVFGVVLLAGGQIQPQS